MNSALVDSSVSEDKSTRIRSKLSKSNGECDDPKSNLTKWGSRCSVPQTQMATTATFQDLIEITIQQHISSQCIVSVAFLS